MFVLLVPWFIVLNKFNRETAVFATFWASMVYNTVNYYWIRNVMNVETAPAGLIFLGLILLIAYLSLFNVLASFIYSTVKDLKFKGKAYLLVLFPIFFASIEMFRTYGDFAFPWNHLGYTLGNHIELIQTLSIIGIFGYTILIIASNQIVAYAFQQSGRKRFALFAVPFIIFFALLIHGNYVLSAPEAAPFYNADNEENPAIAMVQPSIAQGAKWSKERFDSIVTQTFSMAMDSSKPGTNLILLAETAIPDHIRRQPIVLKQLHQMADAKNVGILTGALDYKRVSADPIKTPKSTSFRFINGIIGSKSKFLYFKGAFNAIGLEVATGAYTLVKEGNKFVFTAKGAKKKGDWKTLACRNAVGNKTMLSIDTRGTIIFDHNTKNALNTKENKTMVAEYDAAKKTFKLTFSKNKGFINVRTIASHANASFMGTLSSHGIALPRIRT